MMILIKRYLVTGKLDLRKQNRSESEPGIDSKRGTGRPRIQITGPKVKPLIFQICLRRVKQRIGYVKCSYGGVFHTTCISRTGFCSYCQS
ncbi:MAG: hypothetical protein ABSB83_06030 [Methanomassiliicoccales archaeon]